MLSSWSARKVDEKLVLGERIADVLSVAVGR